MDWNPAVVAWIVSVRSNFKYGKYISLHIATYSLICCDNLASLKSGNHA